MKSRQLALGGALAVTLAATAWVATRPEEDAAAPAVAALPTRKPAASAPEAPKPVVAADERQPWAEAGPAQLSAWQPPPPPPPPPAPPPVVAAPPPPMAPPLPYQMIGRVVEGDGAQAVEVALLAGPNKALSVRRGDVIDGQWRVEQVSTSGISLTWLPAKLPQNIVFKAVP
ncbi:hypothetical protein ACG04R_01390 [Roseateles sp. BYS78W]|uniref:Uncharacterized protein n=1 Tax=Pelomonas candidula TaxID=3299025 RepID=A0ABW7H6X4_9BURK